MKLYIKALRVFSKDKKIDSGLYNIFAFDSFEGLPNFTGERDYNPNWQAGLYSGSEADIIATVKAGGTKAKITTIRGFYEESLTNNLYITMAKNPPSIVNIDVDFYSSAITVLNWLYPLLQNGTLIYFDDVYDYLGDPRKGELAAIKHFSERKGVSLTPFYQHGIPLVFGKSFIFNRID